MNARIKRTAGVLVGVLVCMFVVLTVMHRPSGSVERHAALPPAREALELRVAAIVPLTGWAAEFGTHEKAAAEIACDSLRQSCRDAQVSLVVEDTGSEVKGAVNALQRLLLTEPRPQVFLVESSSASLALGPEIDKNKALMISIAANPAVTRTCSNAFRCLVSADEESRALCSYITQQKGIKSLAILYINDDYGKGYVSAFESLEQPLGFRVAGAEPYASDSKDCRPMVTKLVDLKPEAVFVVGYGSAMGLVIKQLREYPYPGMVLACSSVVYDDVMGVAPSAMEGVVFCDVPFPRQPVLPAEKDFVDDFIKRVGKGPNPGATMIFDAVRMVGRHVMQNSGDAMLARESILREGRFEGLNGVVLVPPSRDLTFPLVVKEVRGGKGVVVQ